MLFVNTMPFTIHHSHHWIGVIGKTCLLNIVLSFVPVCLEIESMQWSTVCLIVVENKCSESEKLVYLYKLRMLKLNIPDKNDMKLKEMI